LRSISTLPRLVASKASENNISLKPANQSPYNRRKKQPAFGPRRCGFESNRLIGDGDYLARRSVWSYLAVDRARLLGACYGQQLLGPLIRLFQRRVSIPLTGLYGPDLHGVKARRF
jgi:hypothetical protein